MLALAVFPCCLALQLGPFGRRPPGAISSNHRDRRQRCEPVLANEGYKKCVFPDHAYLAEKTQIRGRTVGGGRAQCVVSRERNSDLRQDRGSAADGLGAYRRVPGAARPRDRDRRELDGSRLHHNRSREAASHARSGGGAAAWTEK